MSILLLCGPKSEDAHRYLRDLEHHCELWLIPRATEGARSDCLTHGGRVFYCDQTGGLPRIQEDLTTDSKRLKAATCKTWRACFAAFGIPKAQRRVHASV